MISHFINEPRPLPRPCRSHSGGLGEQDRRRFGWTVNQSGVDHHASDLPPPRQRPLLCIGMLSAEAATLRSLDLQTSRVPEYGTFRQPTDAALHVRE
jgi:hypothetical protein